MKERDKHASLEPRGAVLDPAAAARAMRLTRHPPGPALAPFVRHYWFIRWDLTGAPPHRQSTLTLPAVNMVVEGDNDSVSGVWTRRFDRVLEGRGAVYGALFRPAGFYAFYGRPMHLLTDRTVRIADVLGGDPEALRRGGDDEAMVRAYDAFLGGLEPRWTPEAAEAEGWVDRVAREPAIGRAEALAEAVGVGLRTLQRGLRTYVGVGPKQLIRRYRLLEASARLARGEDVDQAALALSLGYADQAHFNRDFGAAVGRPPGRYRADQRAR